MLTPQNSGTLKLRRAACDAVDHDTLLSWYREDVDILLALAPSPATLNAEGLRECPNVLCGCTSCNIEADGGTDRDTATIRKTRNAPRGRQIGGRVAHGHS